MSYTPHDPASFKPVKGNYTDLRPFRFWCQKILPLVYDDSLSYYELLCKVVDYLNKTMEDVGVLNDDVTNLFESFDELQDYTNVAYEELTNFVNNYFDNLDVQNEINEKLDEMALDGSLSELVSPLLPNIVTAWLDENITPTSPIIDESLTITGAGADAKVTGDLKSNIDENYNALLLESEIPVELSFNLGYSLRSNGEYVEAYPTNSRASTKNFYETFGEITVETDGTEYAIGFYDSNVEGSSGTGTEWIDHERTFTTNHKYFRVVIKNDNGFVDWNNHLVVKTKNPLYERLSNESKYLQNNTKLFSVNKEINSPYNVKFNRKESNSLVSNKLYVNNNYVIINKESVISEHYVNIKIEEYSNNDTLLNTVENWSFLEYIGHNSTPIAYIVITVTYGGDLNIPDSVKSQIENNIIIYEKPKVTTVEDNTFIKTNFIDAVFDGNYVLRPITGNIRLISDFISINDNMNIWANKSSDFKYYLKYYGDGFSFLGDGSLHEKDNICEFEGSKYIRFVVTIKSSISVDDAIEELENNSYILNSKLSYKRVTGAGELVFSDNNRMSTDYLYIKNGCVSIDLEKGFDVYISHYDKNKNFIGQSAWYSKNANSNEYLLNDMVVKDEYIIITFALTNDRTAYITDDLIINASSIFEIREYEYYEKRLNDNYFYPDYYGTEVQNVINNVMENDKNMICFGMITDLHDNNVAVTSTLLNQIEALRKLTDSLNIEFIILGGDLTDGAYKTKESCIQKFTKLVNEFSKINTPILTLRGNHDDNSYQGSKNKDIIVNKKEFYNTVVAPLSGGTNSEVYNYYYKDFGKYRIICLDYLDYPEIITNDEYTNVGSGGGWRGYSNEQVKWLCETLENTNIDVIVASHYSTNARLMDELHFEVVNRNYESVTNAMLAYNNKTTFSFDGVTYDFSNTTGKIVIQVSGHSHSFGAFVQNGIVWSTTGSPSPEVTIRTHSENEWEDMVTRNYYTESEAHFNIFCVSRNKVNIISFGAMNDLSFTL